MQVRNCCRRGSKQELVNARFFCIKSLCRVEYFRFYIAGSRRTALPTVSPCSLELLQVSQAATAASCALELRAAL